jgi:hypothetical protein
MGQAGNPNWKPGQSGNPKGRPKKERALTEILQRAGSAMVALPDGTRTSSRSVLARALWDLATSGKAELPGGKVIGLGEDKDWLPVVKFIYSQIDGPPPAALDLTSNGQTVLLTDDERLARIVAILDAARTRRDGQAADGADPDVPGVHPAG